MCAETLWKYLLSFLRDDISRLAQFMAFASRSFHFDGNPFKN